MPVAVLALLGTPFLALAGAFLRAVILFWPTMILLGAAHSHLPWIPPLGAVATFLIVALISILVPTGDTFKD